MNRRGLNRGFDSAWNRGLADQSPLGLVLCDVDNFKAYNDALGHQAGDACLEQIGMALRTGLRANDTLVARYGGEEFAILVTNSSPDGILKMGERVRDLIANLQIQHPASSVAGHVTISVGVSQLQPSAQTKVEVLLNSADDALYRAKASGRNCVQFVAPEPRNKTISNRPSSAGEVSDNSSKAVWCSDSYKFL
jgi:diguanylate cyclase (GGDEF)-like protein